MINGQLAYADRSYTELDPPRIQDIYSNSESFSSIAQHVFNWHRHIVEKELTSGGAFNPHFLFFGTLAHSSIGFLHDKSRKILIVLHFGEDNEHVSKTSISNPHLLPIQDIVGSFLIEHCFGLARVGI